MVLKIFTEVYRYNKKKKGDALRQRRHYAKKRDREFDNDTGYEKLPENYKYTRGRPPTAYKMLLASQSSANSLSGPNVALLDTLLHTSKYDKFSHEDFIAEIEGLNRSRRTPYFHDMSPGVSNADNGSCNNTSPLNQSMTTNVTNYDSGSWQVCACLCGVYAG